MNAAHFRLWLEVLKWLYMRDLYLKEKENNKKI